MRFLDGRSEWRGSFLVPWLIFLFLWSVPLIIGEFALGKEVEQVQLELSEYLLETALLDGIMDSLISTAIGFYYAVVTGCINYFQTAIRGGLGSEVDTVQVWNDFLQDPTQVIFSIIVVLITMAAIWKGAGH